MNRVTIATAVVATCAICAGHAQAATKYLSWEGKWALNTSTTHYPASIPVTANDLDVTKDDGNILQYTDTVVVSGKSMNASFDGAYDNKPHDAGGGATLTYRHISKTKFASVRLAADGSVAERSTCKLSTDGKAYSCHVELPQPKGKAIVFDEFFDRKS
jgi:hypothetical protein